MADKPERVLVEFRDVAGARVAYVTLNRPEKYNGLDGALLRSLPHAARRVAADPDVRAVLLQGAGSSFCSGLDFADFERQPTWRRAVDFARLPGRETNLYQRACWAWRRLAVPVVAVTRGHCYGAGFQLALAADFRFSTPECQFSVMEARWGLIPDMTGSVTMRELLPLDVAKRLAITEVADDPLAPAEALLAELVLRSPDALAATKRLFRTTWTRAPRWAFWAESVLQARLLTGANHRIARTAGLAGSTETPGWTARRIG
jgi:enoyl-CoA hydratase/carnithine racemase